MLPSLEPQRGLRCACPPHLSTPDITDYMSKNPENTEIDSNFSNEEGDGFNFNLTQMEILVSQKLGTPCHLRKLAEGAYHGVRSGSFTLSFPNPLTQVYGVVVAAENEVKAVTPVALPDFPMDNGQDGV